MIFPKLLVFYLFSYISQLNLQCDRIKNISNELRFTAYGNKQQAAILDEIKELVVNLNYEIEKLYEIPH